jgi:hypothetical protein
MSEHQWYYMSSDFLGNSQMVGPISEAVLGNFSAVTGDDPSVWGRTMGKAKALILEKAEDETTRN